MKFLPVIFIILVLAIFPVLNACNRDENPSLRVATSTSLIEYIVEQIGGNRVEVINLVPPNLHPGNFDIKPGDIENLADAKLFLLHGYPGEAYADKLIVAANNPDLIVARVSIDGNWMIPSVQSAAAEKIAGILSEIDPDNADFFESATENYKQRIQVKEREITNRLSDAAAGETNVIVSIRQADFLTWAGFNVVATFGVTQSLTPQLIQELVEQGRASQAVLVVNNLQDGKDAGKAVAEELSAENVNLSNFPGGLDNTETWEQALDRNVTILLDAITRVNAEAN
jgi:zinc transport system substrate-binding protein